MIQILSQYEENGYLITEYTKDGVSVSHIVKTPIQTEPIEPTEPQPTIEDITEDPLLETKYQTLLLEMML